MSEVSERIAIFIPSLKGGGAERIMVILANRLDARGYVVDLVLSHARGPYLRDVAPQVNIVDLSSSRVLRSLPGLIKYLRQSKPRALLSALEHANVVAIMAKRLSRVDTRVVVSERNHFSSSRANALTLRSRMLSFFIRWAYRRADAVIAISGGVADDLSVVTGLSRDQVRVVYNPVVMPDLEQDFEVPDHPWFADKNTPIVVGMGRLVPQKDFQTLILAIDNLRHRRSVRLLILGEGYLKQDLQSLINDRGLEDHVQLLGFTNTPQIYLKHSSVFVFSSRWEGFGNVLVEAMALGTPVVSTDCPSGPAEILGWGKWGRLVPVGDAQSLADAIDLTLDSPDAPDVVARASDFSVDRAVDGYLAALLPQENQGVIR